MLEIKRDVASPPLSQLRSGLSRTFEAAVKTIQLDFEFMRDQLELPNEYAPSRRGRGLNLTINILCERYSDSNGTVRLAAIQPPAI